MNNWSWIAAASFGLLLFSQVAHAEQTVPINVKATNSSAAFRKFIFAWPLAKSGLFTGLSGSFSTSSSANSFGEALMSLWASPSGSCPRSGEAYDSYQQIRSRYPGASEIYANILKSVKKGDTTEPVSFRLLNPVPISKCVYIILDGSILTGGPFTMSSDLQLHFEVEPAPRDLAHVDVVDGEYCFGMKNGCGTSHAQEVGTSFFQYYLLANGRSVVSSLHGDLAVSAFSPDLKSRYSFSAAAAEWMVKTTLYVVAECPQGPHVVANRTASAPPSAVAITSVSAYGNGLEATNVSVDKSTNEVIPTGGCIGALTQEDGEGGIDAEFQIMTFAHKSSQR